MVAWIGVEEWRWGGMVRFYYNLKEEAAGFAGRAGVVWEGKKGVKDDAKLSDLSNWKGGIAKNWNGKTAGEVGLGEEGWAGSHCTQNKPKHITTASKCLHDLSSTHLSASSHANHTPHLSPCSKHTRLLHCLEHAKLCPSWGALRTLSSLPGTQPHSPSPTPPSCFNPSGLNLQVASLDGNSYLTSLSRVYFLCSTYTSTHLIFLFIWPHSVFSTSLWGPRQQGHDSLVHYCIPSTWHIIRTQ